MRSSASLLGMMLMCSPIIEADEDWPIDYEALIRANEHDLLGDDYVPLYVAERRDWGEQVEQWRPLVAGHFPSEAVETMLCLMGYESGGLATADNPRSTARGLMQVLKGWSVKFGVSYTDLYNPSINLWISRKLYDDNTYWHWSPYVRGLCRGL